MFVSCPSAPVYSTHLIHLSYLPSGSRNELRSPVRVCARAVKTLRTTLAQAGRRLQFYQKLEAGSQESPCLLALSVLGRGNEAEVRGFSSLPPLPPLHELSTEECIEREESPPLSAGGAELPSDLQPELQDDGLPDQSSENDLESDEVDDSPESEDVLEFDALDLKNAPDFDPDQGADAEFYGKSVVNGWIRLDDQQCAQGP